MDSDNNPKMERPGVGRRVSHWLHAGRRRGFAVDVLDVTGIASIDRTLLEVDATLVELDHRVDASKRQVKQAGRHALHASYPWLMMAPLGLLIGIQSRAAIKKARLAPAITETPPTTESSEAHAGQTPERPS